MLLRRLSGAGVFVVLAGCHTPPVKDPEVGVITQKICTDDTTNCKDPNGTGVYTAESGSARIGDVNLMITHFINNGAGVSFAGRYFDSAQKQWSALPTPGVVYAAAFQGKARSVTAVSETSTTVQWKLSDPVTHVMVMAPDAGQPLTDLTLYVQIALPRAASSTEPRTAPTPIADHATGVLLPAPPAPSLPGGDLRYYALGVKLAGTATTDTNQSLAKYDLTWRDLQSAGVPSKSYCADANGVADPVVFQQGIDVDPITGRVAPAEQATGLVTMSCSLGAPAKVYGWGYSYHPSPGTAATDMYYFAAAIQMKRASYCGDENHYTVAGTEISIVDDRHIHPGLQLPDTIKTVEAWWAEAGARCVTLPNRRHLGMAFNGTCPNRVLPSCDSLNQHPKAPYLLDAPAVPGAQ